MATRIKPPHHPVTGYPQIDNELRNAWREHRAWLTSIGPAKAAAAVSGGAGVWPVNPPRTMKKQAAKTSGQQLSSTTTSLTASASASATQG